MRRKFHQTVINTVLGLIYNAAKQRPPGILVQVDPWFVRRKMVLIQSYVNRYAVSIDVLSYFIVIVWSDNWWFKYVSMYEFGKCFNELITM